MYTVWAFDEMVFDDVVLFTGTLAQCKEFKGTDDELIKTETKITK